MREFVSTMIDASPVSFVPVDNFELPALHDSSQQTISVKTGSSEEQLSISMAKEVSAAVFDCRHKESRDDSDLKSLYAVYVANSRHGVGMKGFNSGKLPKEFEGMKAQAFKGEPDLMHDALGEIRLDIHKSLEKNKSPKSKEQER